MSYHTVIVRPINPWFWCCNIGLNLELFTLWDSYRHLILFTIPSDGKQISLLWGRNAFYEGSSCTNRSWLPHAAKPVLVSYYTWTKNVFSKCFLTPLEKPVRCIFIMSALMMTTMMMMMNVKDIYNAPDLSRNMIALGVYSSKAYNQ